MFGFQQYLGFVVAMGVVILAFWLLLFLVGFACYWATGGVIELLKEKRAKRKAVQQQV